MLVAVQKCYYCIITWIAYLQTHPLVEGKNEGIINTHTPPPPQLVFYHIETISPPVFHRTGPLD